MGDEPAAGRFVMSDPATPIVRIHLAEMINTVDHHQDVPQVQPASELCSLARTASTGDLRTTSRDIVRDRVPSRLGGETASAEEGSPAIVVSGRPSELIPSGFGRGGQGIVELSCDPCARPSLNQPHLGLRRGVWLTGRRRHGGRPGDVTAVRRGFGFSTLPVGTIYRDLSLRIEASFANADPRRFAESTVSASCPLAAGSYLRQDRRLSR
jgi:hypothetical protein